MSEHDTRASGTGASTGTSTGFLETTVDDATLARLHARLEDSPDVDVAYRLLDSPLGPLLLAATERGLVRVGFAGVSGSAQDDLLAELVAGVSPRVLLAPRRTDEVARELDEYFAGTRRRFDVPLDPRLARGFRAAVIARLPEIAYGSTASYAQVAGLVGSPRAIRAVGTACALNPLPVVLPCHRVVRSDGSMGRYAGGEAAKRLLLDLEGAA